MLKSTAEPHETMFRSEYKVALSPRGIYRSRELSLTASSERKGEPPRLVGCWHAASVMRYASSSALLESLPEEEDGEDCKVARYIAESHQFHVAGGERSGKAKAGGERERWMMQLSLQAAGWTSSESSIIIIN